MGIGGATHAQDRRSSERLFHRDLPGGGYVTIEITGAPNAANRTVRVLVERRSDRARRAGHQPPVIHEVPWTEACDVGDQYRIASDNVAIARALLRLRRAD